MNVVVFEVEPWERETFGRLDADHRITYVEEPLTERNADQHAEAEVISTFIYSDLGGDVLSRFPDLRLIATRSTGFDHIDERLCRERGISVANVPSYGAHTVAEHVFGLLLAISHHLVEAVDRTRRGDFSLQALRGFDLREKTLGVIGTGDIGRCVIEIATGFRMVVVAYDIAPDRELEQRLGFRYASLDEVLEASDIVSLHVPLNDSTHHMISTPQFERMKDGVVLINTARGSVVDTQALLHAIADGSVAAAGLDVLPAEPAIREEAELLRSIFRKQHDLETLLADHVLLRLRNVVITPHSAFNTREAVQRILDVTVENIAAFAEGRSRNVVVGASA